MATRAGSTICGREVSIRQRRFPYSNILICRELRNRLLYSDSPQRRHTQMAVPRTKCLTTKVTDQEYATFAPLARSRSVTEQAREGLLHAATRPATEQLLLSE